MNKPWLIGGLTLGLAVAVLVLTDSETENSSSVTTKLVAQNNIPTKTADHSSSQNQNATNMPSPSEVEDSQEIAQQVEVALMQFDEVSQYPPTSQPILNERHVHAFVNSSTPQSSLPFPFEDLTNPIQVSIELDQNNYFFGDPIRAKIDISQVPEGANIATRAVLMSIDGEVLVESAYQETKDQSTFVVFDTQVYDTAKWPIEMNVGAYIDVDGKSIFITAPFKINDETASLDSIGFSEPVAENLVIPVNLEVKLGGYYHLAAVLYSTTSGKPLIHLETEGPLSEGLQSLQLKAHIQALKKSDDEGPYYLDKIRIERWSDEIIPRDIAGKVNQDEYKIEGFSFNDYEDKPYLDPLAEERKRLLQGLSSRL